MDREEDGILRETILLLRKIAPLGIVVLVSVSVGVLFVSLLSWLGEVLLQIPLQNSLPAFADTAVLLAVAFALFGPLLSDRILSHVAVKAKTPSPLQGYDLVPQLDLRVKEAEKPPKEKGILGRFKDRLEAEAMRERREVSRWEDKLELSRPETSPRAKDLPSKADVVRPKAETVASAPRPYEPSKTETKTSRMERIESKLPVTPETAKPGVWKDTSQEIPEVQPPAPAAPQRLAFRIDQMSFNCSFCNKSASLPWEKVQESQKGTQVTFDCPHCHNQYPFNYDLARGKMLSGRIGAA